MLMEHRGLHGSQQQWQQRVDDFHRSPIASAVSKLSSFQVHDDLELRTLRDFVFIGINRHGALSFVGQSSHSTYTWWRGPLSDTEAAGLESLGDLDACATKKGAYTYLIM